MIPNFDSGLQLALTLQSGLPPGAASALVSDLSGPVAVAAALVGIGILMAALRRRMRATVAVALAEELRKAA